MSGKSEQVVFSSEELRGIEEIGDFFIQVGQKLKDQGFFNVVQGNEEVEIRPAGTAELELKYKIKGEKHEFEIEIEWKPGNGKVGIA